VTKETYELFTEVSQKRRRSFGFELGCELGFELFFELWKMSLDVEQAVFVMYISV